MQEGWAVGGVMVSLAAGEQASRGGWLLRSHTKSDAVRKKFSYLVCDGLLAGRLSGRGWRGFLCHCAGVGKFRGFSIGVVEWLLGAVADASSGLLAVVWGVWARWVSFSLGISVSLGMARVVMGEGRAQS